MKKFLCILLSTIFILVLFSGCGVSEQKQKAIDSFNSSIKTLKTKNAELDKLIKSSDKIIKENKKPYDEKTLTTFETMVSNAKVVKLNIPEMPNDENKINQLVEKINGIDYTNVINDIIIAKQNYQTSIKQLLQITKPQESFVIARLKKVKGIKGISAVTEENDPNGQLGKQGGYISQVYFSYNKIKQSEILGNSIIDKGTDCGGSIETYNNENDAKNRDSYLANFDGGMLSSGSHRVLGTMVVRTSSELTASQQKELENNIVNSLLEVKENK